MDLSASTRIARPPAEVFAYVMDVRHDVDWRTGVVEAAFTTDHELGVGSEGFDRVDANGRQMTSRWVVTEFVAGSHARWELVEGPISGTGGYICELAEGGTTFTLESHVQPTGAYRMLGPVFGWMGRRQNRADVDRLKQLLESSR